MSGLPEARRLDHLVYATPDLDGGVARIEDLLGIRATPGGRHPSWATRNALIALGRDTYLELIGPDPERPPPGGGRPFGIDALAAPALVTWAAKSGDLARVRADGLEAGVRLGEVCDGHRGLPDGSVLRWRLTDPAAVVADGLVPFFIDWGRSPHPAAAAATGARLVALRAEHPDARAVGRVVSRLGLDLRVGSGARPKLSAIIEGNRGEVALE